MLALPYTQSQGNHSPSNYLVFYYPAYSATKGDLHADDVFSAAKFVRVIEMMLPFSSAPRTRRLHGK
jgi:hypothetical protein